MFIWKTKRLHIPRNTKATTNTFPSFGMTLRRGEIELLERIGGSGRDGNATQKCAPPIVMMTNDGKRQHMKSYYRRMRKKEWKEYRRQIDLCARSNSYCGKKKSAIIYWRSHKIYFHHKITMKLQWQLRRTCRRKGWRACTASDAMQRWRRQLPHQLNRGNFAKNMNGEDINRNCHSFNYYFFCCDSWWTERNFVMTVRRTIKLQQFIV